MSGSPLTLDPYKSFNFRIKWDGRYVAAVSKVSALKRPTEVVRHREGADPASSHKSPGETEFEPVVLERGVTGDTAFEDWANSVWSYTNAAGASSSQDLRKDILIELCNEAGQVVLAYKIYRCWVSEYTAMSELDASSSAVCFERIQIENEGWERDAAVVPPPPQP